MLFASIRPTIRFYAQAAIKSIGQQKASLLVA